MQFENTEACKKSNTVAKISIVSSPMTMVNVRVHCENEVGFRRRTVGTNFSRCLQRCCYCLSTFALDEDVKKCFVHHHHRNSRNRSSRNSTVAQFEKPPSRNGRRFQDCLPNLVLSIFEWWVGPRESLDWTTPKRKTLW